jgi:serine/threonine protein kinase
MGEVWRARHRTQHATVAVKVLTAEGSSKPMFVDSFRNEVRAVAGLDHPGVVWVFDVGSVPPAAAAGSGGMLEAGAPYLAMEYASGGTLAEFVPASPGTRRRRCSWSCCPSSGTRTPAAWCTAISSCRT